MLLGISPGLPAALNISEVPHREIWTECRRHEARMLSYTPCLYQTDLPCFANNLMYSRQLNPSSCASLAMIFLAI